MDSKKIYFEITTPERNVYRDEIDSVSLPTTLGQITVLPEHIPLIASIEPGELIIRKAGKEILVAISGGILEVKDGGHLVVLADTAEHAEEIDEGRAEEARQKAEAILKEKREDAEDYAVLAAKLQRELARLRVVKKHRNKKGIEIK